MHSIGCNQVLIDYGDNNKYLLEAAVLSFFDSIIYKIFQKLRKDDSHVRLSVQASQRSQRTMDAYVSFKTLSKNQLKYNMALLMLMINI